MSNSKNLHSRAQAAKATSTTKIDLDEPGQGGSGLPQAPVEPGQH